LEVTSESSVKRMGGISWNIPVDLFRNVRFNLQAPVAESGRRWREMGSRWWVGGGGWWAVGGADCPPPHAACGPWAISHISGPLRHWRGTVTPKLTPAPASIAAPVGWQGRAEQWQRQWQLLWLLMLQLQLQ
jgi:hypothetical protein